MCRPVPSWENIFTVPSRREKYIFTVPSCHEMQISLYCTSSSRREFSSHCPVPSSPTNNISSWVELYADLFSRHASPLEFCAFLAVDERGENVTSDEICRRCNGKPQIRRRGGRSVQLPDWVMNKIKRQHIITLTWLLGHQNEVTFVGGISKRCPANTQHPPTFQCEAIRVSEKSLQSRWVGILLGRWVWVTNNKKNGVNNKYVRAKYQQQSLTKKKKNVSNYTK